MICKEELVGGRAWVTTEEVQVQCEGLTEIKLYRYEDWVVVRAL